MVTEDGTPLSGVSKVVPDDFYGSCAVLTSTGADCWGDNQFGQAGNGSIGSSQACTYGSCISYASPVVETSGAGALSGVSNLVSAPLAVCAIVTAGNVDCWGDDQFGELGDGGTLEESATPVVIDAPGSTNPLGGVTKMATDGNGFCAVATGGLDCWGEYQPVSAVASVGNTGALNGVSDVASSLSGWFEYCAILNSGHVDCFDAVSNELGELGDGGFGSVSVPPAPASPYYGESPSSVFGPTPIG